MQLNVGLSHVEQTIVDWSLGHQVLDFQSLVNGWSIPAVLCPMTKFKFYHNANITTEKNVAFGIARVT